MDKLINIIQKLSYDPYSRGSLLSLTLFLTSLGGGRKKDYIILFSLCHSLNMMWVQNQECHFVVDNVILGHFLEWQPFHWNIFNVVKFYD